MNKYSKYGISSDLSEKLESLKISISALRNTPKRDLKDKYFLSQYEVDCIKDCLIRKPIDDNVLNYLLEKSAYTCNICKGIKGTSFIIHHIDHYNETQDNSYENLIVLCPNDHELAHREGECLANKITKKQLLLAKKKWEKEVEDHKIRIATLSGEIHDIDYINVNRVLEIAIQIIGEIPDTKYTNKLKLDDLILNTGGINPELYERYNLNKNTPLKFFALYGSTMLAYHYYSILLECFARVQVYDLDLLLNPTEIKKGIIGKFCYYVGGVYGRQYKGEINENSEPTILHFRRKSIRIIWKIDPMYITSTTASWRIGSRCIFLIYGKILNVTPSIEKDKKILIIEIRPYAYGLPVESKDRTPLIHYINQNFEEYFENEGQELEDITE